VQSLAAAQPEKACLLNLLEWEVVKAEAASATSTAAPNV
jgi:hypothetical protein